MMKPLIAALLISFGAAITNAADTLDALGGTWGLPPVDGKLGVSGSYFTIAPVEGGGVHAKLNLYASDWDCRADSDVVGNATAARYEWPNRSNQTGEDPCWVQLAPQKDRLNLKVYCPYECTDGEHTHAITLEHMAADRLVPPEHVLPMFCATHDTLRQELCRPGEIQNLIVEGNHAARQRRVLAGGDDDTPLLPDTTAELLTILENCRTADAGRACLVQALRERRDAHAATVAHQQKTLAEEKQKSEAAAVPIADPAAWTGVRYLVNDSFVAALTIDGCDAHHCAFSVEGDTNYTFGYQENHGECFHQKNALTLTAADRGFSYEEPDESDRDEEGAGPFANFCRLDLIRSGDTIHVNLRGAGCASRCSNAQYPGLAGDYHPHPKPSFNCPPDGFFDPWDEQNICLDPELAALDRDLAGAFTKAKAGVSGAAQTALVKAQRAWIAKRREDCNAGERHTCLVAAYRRRLEALTRP